MLKPALKAGALFAAAAVIFGAFGAHGLSKILPPEKLVVYEKGVMYQFYHSFALLITGMIYATIPAKQLRLAMIFFIVGIVLFCGSLYALVFLSMAGLGLGAVGIITPIGGVSFILGWIFLFLGVAGKNQNK